MAPQDLALANERRHRPMRLGAARDGSQPAISSRRGSGLQGRANHVPAAIRGRHGQSDGQPRPDPSRGGDVGQTRACEVGEQALLRAAREGEESNRARFVEVFTPSIAGVARAYRSTPSVAHSELMQAGVVGLLQALERFDFQRGAPFWAYASWYVRQAMQQLVSELCGPVVLSDRAHRQLALVVQKHVEQVRANRNDPKRTELATDTGLPRGKVEQLLAARQVPRSLDSPFREGADAGTTLADTLTDRCAETPYERVARRDDIARLPSLLEQLSERERTIVCAHFGLGQPEVTLAQLGLRLGVSAERVRQVEQTALEKLRHRESGSRDRLALRPRG